MKRQTATHILLISCILLIAGCNSHADKVAQQQRQTLTRPNPPVILTSPEQRAEFIATHYWDNFDFRDTTLIGNADITEQAYVDFVAILPMVKRSVAMQSIHMMMRSASVDSTMYAHFIKLAEQYLYEPNSPVRNEDFYIEVLQNIIANPKIDTLMKIRPQYQLNLAMKNRIGMKATDFEYSIGRNKARLYDTKGETVLIFFYRPECQTCKEIMGYVANHGINNLTEIIWVNPEKDTYLEKIYDLRASPTLYLLDSNKTVLLKDAPIEQIESYLKNKRDGI